MRIKAGRYTLALTMIASGIMMIINNIYRSGLFENLWMYSPVVLIVFGLEVLVLNAVYGSREGYKVEISIGSLILIFFIIAIFMLNTARIRVDNPFLENFL